MNSFFQKSRLWLLFHKNMESLNELYLQRANLNLEQKKNLPILIALMNRTNKFVYSTLPDYKFYFLADYLILWIENNRADLAGFIYFLFENGAALDGVYAVKDYLLRELFKTQSHFGLLQHLFEEQGFKLEEHLTLMAHLNVGKKNKKRLEQLNKSIEFEVKLKRIYDALQANPDRVNTEIVRPEQDKVYLDVPLLKPNSCAYHPVMNYFLYADYSGHLKIVEQFLQPNPSLQSFINVALQYKQHEINASIRQIATIRTMVSQSIPVLEPLDQHPVYAIQNNPETEMNAYFLSNCRRFTSSADTPLILAVRYSCYDLIFKLMKQYPSQINERNGLGEDPLSIAIQRKDLQSFALLKSDITQLLTPNPLTGYHALHIAAFHRDLLLLCNTIRYTKGKSGGIAALFSDSNQSIFHFILEKNLFTVQDLIHFIRECDVEPTTNKPAPGMEAILYSLWCYACNHNDKELAAELVLYLWDTRYQNKLADFLRQLMTISKQLSVSFCPHLNEFRPRPYQDSFCDEEELTYYYDCWSEKIERHELIKELPKLLVFSLKENKPEFVQKLVEKYQLDVNGMLCLSPNLFIDCISTQAYAAAEWVMSAQNGISERDLNHIAQLINQSQDNLGHLGHRLAADNQLQLFNVLLSFGCFDGVLFVKDFEERTLLDIALLKNRFSMVKTVLDYLEQGNNSSLLDLSIIREKRLLLMFYRDVFPGMSAKKNHLINGRSLSHFASLYFSDNNSDWLDVIEQLYLDCNQYDQEGKTLICRLIEAGKTTDLLSLIKKIKPNLFYLDAKGSTLLHLACDYEDDVLIQECLLNKKWQQKIVYQREGDGLSPLDICVEKQNTVIFGSLWKSLKPNAQNKYIAHLNAHNVQESIAFMRSLHLMSNPKRVKVKAGDLCSVTTDTAPQESPTLTSTIETNEVDDEINLAANPLPQQLQAEEEIYQKIIDALDSKHGGVIRQIKQLKCRDVADLDVFKDFLIKMLVKAIEQQKTNVIYQLLRLPGVDPVVGEQGLKLIVQAQTQANTAIIELLMRHQAIKDSLYNQPLASIALFQGYLLDKHPELAKFYNDFPLTRETAKAACSNHDLDFIKTFLATKKCANSKSTLADNVAFKKALLMNDYDLLEELLLDYCDNPILPTVDWLSKPICYIENIHYRKVIRELAELFKTLNVSAKLYGSGNYSAGPNDIDYLVNLYRWRKDDGEVINRIMHLLHQQGANITLDNLGRWGYEKNGRHVVPISWQGVNIELIFSTLDYKEHARLLDFTIGALYFDEKLRMNQVDGINACTDLANKELKTINDAKSSLREDPVRIFRMVRLRAKFNFRLSQECREAIQLIANDQSMNIFLEMNRDKLSHQLAKLLATESPKRNIEILDDLNLLDSICAALNQNPSQVKGAFEIRTQFFQRVTVRPPRLNYVTGAIDCLTPSLGESRGLTLFSSKNKRKSKKNQNTDHNCSPVIPSTARDLHDVARNSL